MGCCIHIMRPDGRLVPFCVQNLTAVDGSMLYPDRLHPGSPEDGGGHGG